jgi:hypothetical protein
MNREPMDRRSRKSREWLLEGIPLQSRWMAIYGRPVHLYLNRVLYPKHQRLYSLTTKIYFWLCQRLPTPTPYTARGFTQASPDGPVWKIPPRDMVVILPTERVPEGQPSRGSYDCYEYNGIKTKLLIRKGLTRCMP